MEGPNKIHQVFFCDLSEGKPAVSASKFTWNASWLWMRRPKRCQNFDEESPKNPSGMRKRKHPRGLGWVSCGKKQKIYTYIYIYIYKQEPDSYQDYLISQGFMKKIKWFHFEVLIMNQNNDWMYSATW